MLQNKRQIVLDTETTGLYAYHASNPDRLIEFAGLEMVNRQLTGESLHLLVHPQRDIPKEASDIHNITLDQLVDKPVFAQVAQQIFDFIKGAELIIHNAKFDVGFLNMEFGRVGLPNVETICDVVDTLEMAKEKYVGQRNSLDALCTRLGVDRSKRVFHGALIDCELLAEVYLAMTRGQFSLMDNWETEAIQHSKQEIVEYQNITQNLEHLKVIMANHEELSAHEQFLDDLSHATGGLCLYRVQNQSPVLPEDEVDLSEDGDEEEMQ